ncbi:hypothetical protein [Tsukamurella soli]|uniref:Stc1 domain-containing protein n=1 Tax=Tsukamurella soli TaxID=644556 RepID=A0ABP8JT77_9ACTN
MCELCNPGPEDAPDTSQECVTCRRELPLDRFAKRTASALGRQRNCRECAAAATRAYRARKRAAALGGDL